VFENVGAIPLTSGQITTERQHVQFGHACVLTALDIEGTLRH
jgi:hypothetical protein